MDKKLLVFGAIAFFFFTKKEEVVDPCAGKDCGSYGWCKDGTCVCSKGYTGDNCQTSPGTIYVPEDFPIEGGLEITTTYT